MTRAPYRSPAMLGIVFIGGALGTGTREALNLAFGDINGVPVTIFAINILGAFVLGALVTSLATRGSDDRFRALRIFLGTGVLGGFTTYSALAYDSASLMGLGRTGWALAYAVGSVILGVLASLAGVAIGGWLGRRRIGGTA